MWYGPRILNVSYDMILLETRSAILRTAGYAVRPARTLTRAMVLLKRGAFDLVVIGHSMPAVDTQTLLATAHSASTPVLVMARGTEQVDAEADFVFTAADGPHAFLRAIHSLVHAKAACAAV